VISKANTVAMAMATVTATVATVESVALTVDQGRNTATATATANGTNTNTNILQMSPAGAAVKAAVSFVGELVATSPSFSSEMMTRRSRERESGTYCSFTLLQFCSFFLTVARYVPSYFLSNGQDYAAMCRQQEIDEEQ